MSGGLYTIRDGNWTESPIPTGGVTMPIRDDEGGPIRALTGSEDEFFLSWTLPKLVEIFSVIAPFATVHCAPTFSEPDWWGLAAAGNVVLLQSSLRPQFSIQTAFHECFHIITEGLTDSEIQIINDIIVPVRDWPTDYLRTGNEKGARIFEHWASAQFHGMRSQPSPNFPLTKLFMDIYCGKIGKRIVREMNRQRRKPTRFTDIFSWLTTKVASLSA